MRSRLITLTTDFGLSDHYVGVMKGVIASIHPKAQVIDLCHEIRSFSVAEGAFTVAQAYRYFPKRTVHVVVVDPGVGTARRPIVVEAAEHCFVAPDNGVLSQVYEREPHVVRAVDVERYALTPMSHTFHGRDVFAPVAAWLSKGKSPSECGEIIHDYVRLEPTAPVFVGDGRWRGRILKIDKFGNLVTSFPSELLRDSRTRIQALAGNLEVRVLHTAYALAAPGEPFAIAGSSGYLELSINQGSAAAAAGVEIGDAVDLTLIEAETPGRGLTIQE